MPFWGEEYVYVWADGIHVNARLENERNQKQCLLVLMGATAKGRKELVAVMDSVRESKQNPADLRPPAVLSLLADTQAPAISG